MRNVEGNGGSPPCGGPSTTPTTTDTNTLVRHAVETDLEDLLALYLAADLAGDGSLGLDEARRLLHRLKANRNYHLYVATDGGTALLAGTYAMLIMDNIAQAGRPLAIVEQVAVTPDRRGQGLGSIMMHHAMAEARKANCYKLQLSSHTRFHKAHAFYDKLGFTRHGYSFYVDL